MNLELYKTDSSPDTINKVMTDKINIVVNLRASTDIKSPEILLGSISGINYLDFNYCHIVELGRYYFIESIDVVKHNIFKLNCSCDVLETYKSEILNCPARYKRALRAGDFMAVNLDTSSFKTVEKFNSQIDIINQETMVLSTISE